MGIRIGAAATVPLEPFAQKLFLARFWARCSDVLLLANVPSFPQLTSAGLGLANGNGEAQSGTKAFAGGLTGLSPDLLITELTTRHNATMTGL